jgi:hypothetical protein
VCVLTGLPSWLAWATCLWGEGRHMTFHFDNPTTPAWKYDDRASPLVCVLIILALSGSGWWASITLALAACAR